MRKQMFFGLPGVPVESDTASAMAAAASAAGAGSPLIFGGGGSQIVRGPDRQEAAAAAASSRKDDDMAMFNSPDDSEMRMLAEFDDIFGGAPMNHGAAAAAASSHGHAPHSSHGGRPFGLRSQARPPAAAAAAAANEAGGATAAAAADDSGFCVGNMSKKGGAGDNMALLSALKNAKKKPEGQAKVAGYVSLSEMMGDTANAHEVYHSSCSGSEFESDSEPEKEVDAPVAVPWQQNNQENAAAAAAAGAGADDMFADFNLSRDDMREEAAVAAAAASAISLESPRDDHGGLGDDESSDADVDVTSATEGSASSSLNFRLDPRDGGGHNKKGKKRHKKNKRHGRVCFGCSWSGGDSQEIDGANMRLCIQIIYSNLPWSDALSCAKMAHSFYKRFIYQPGMHMWRTLEILSHIEHTHCPKMYLLLQISKLKQELKVHESMFYKRLVDENGDQMDIVPNPIAHKLRNDTLRLIREHYMLKPEQMNFFRPDGLGVDMARRGEFINPNKNFKRIRMK